MPSKNKCVCQKKQKKIPRFLLERSAGKQNESGLGKEMKGKEKRDQALEKERKKKKKKKKKRNVNKKEEGPPGFEPGTYRSAVDCSTTEL